MKFNIIPTKEFLKQAKELDKKTKRILSDKIKLLKVNPYRFKKIRGHKLKLFRVRFKIQSKDSRLVYIVIEPNIILLCFIARKKDYNDLSKYIRRFES